MNLTSDNLKRLSNCSNMSYSLKNKSRDFFDIDDSTKKYLNETMGLHFNHGSENNNNMMKRSMTGFDRSFASRPFNRTNSQLKKSHISKMSASLGNGFGLTNKINNLNREYNFPLRLVKQWVYDNCTTTEDVLLFTILVIQRFLQNLRKHQNGVDFR